MFQIAGPTSLLVLEKAAGESLRDIRFLHFRDSSINGIRTEVARIGMSGNLAYELHGPIEEGPARGSNGSAGVPTSSTTSRRASRRERGRLFRPLLPGGVRS